MAQFTNILKLRNTARMVREITGMCVIHAASSSLIFEIGLAYGDEENAKQEQAFKLISMRHGRTVFWRRHYRRIEVCGSTSFQNPI